MIYIIIAITILFSSAIVILLWMLSELTKLLYELEEQVEESLDILDKSYKEISKVLTIPVFYDDPVVKQTIASIKNANQSILMIANKIISFTEQKNKKLL